MSKITFNTFIDMLTVGTPSGGYLLAYDLDGILKQKDQYGVITPITTTASGITASGTLDYITKFNGTNELGDGTWYFSGNNIIPNATGSNIGASVSGGRLSTVYTSAIDFNSAFELKNNDNSVISISGSNIGIGTTGPSTKLHIKSSSPGAFRLEDGTQQSGYILVSDINGVSSWTSSSIFASNLSSVLNVGNTTSTNIVLTTGNSIVSSVTSPYQTKIQINGGSVSSFFIIDNDNSALQKAWVYGDFDSFQSGFDDNYLDSDQSKIQLTSTTGSVTSRIIANSNTNRVSIGVADSSATFSNTYDSIEVLNTRTASITTGNTDKWSTTISSRNSKVNASVRNSVIIGGSGLTASSSNTVYLGNNVNINNAYTLPSTDGTASYVLKTNGAGVVTWETNTTPTLSQVLLTNNTTGTSSINIENSISFDGLGITYSISGQSVGSPLSGFQYFLTGDYTSEIYTGSKIRITNSYGGSNNGDHTITNAVYSGGQTYFQWSGIIASLLAPYGDATTGIEKGYLHLDYANNTNFYTLPNKSGTVSLVSDIIGNGVTASGTTNYISKFNGVNTLTNSNIYDNGTNVGIGTLSPTNLFEVDGTASVTYLKITGGAQNGYYLKSDASGNATWNAISGNGATVSGTTNYIPKFTNTNILGDSSIQDDGSTVTISANLTVLGTSSIVNTTNLSVKDPIILLASTQSGTPMLDSGFFVNRGTGATAAFIWDESDDKFAVIHTNEQDTIAGNVTISSGAELRALRYNFFDNGSPSNPTSPYIYAPFGGAIGINAGALVLYTTSINSSSQNVAWDTGANELMFSGSNRIFRLGVNDSGVGKSTFGLESTSGGVSGFTRTGLSYSHTIGSQLDGGLERTFVIETRDGGTWSGTAVGLTIDVTGVTNSNRLKYGLRILDGKQSNGYVLTSDSNGYASWTSSSNIINVSNGLTYSSGIKLGGDLSQNTTIIGKGYNLVANDLTNYTISGSGSVSMTHVNTNNSIELNDAGYITIGSNGTSWGSTFIALDENNIEAQNFGTGNVRVQNFGTGYTEIAAYDGNMTIYGDRITDIYGGTSSIRGNNSLILDGGNGVQTKISLRGSTTSIANNGNNNVITIQDTIASKGLVYVADYSANFTPESLVSKRYVTNLVTPGTASGIGSVNKYTSLNVSFVAGVTQSFTHSLNSTSIIAQTWDDTTGEIIYGKVFNRTLSSVDIVLTESYSSVDVIIMS